MTRRRYECVVCPAEISAEDHAAGLTICVECADRHEAIIAEAQCADYESPSENDR